MLKNKENKRRLSMGRLRTDEAGLYNEFEKLDNVMIEKKVYYFVWKEQERRPRLAREENKKISSSYYRMKKANRLKKYKKHLYFIKNFFDNLSERDLRILKKRKYQVDFEVWYLQRTM